MDLYQLAVFVLFPLALYIFAFGAAYRVLRYIFLYEKGVYVPRSRGAGHAIKELIMTFLRPVKFASRTNPVEAFAGLVALHFVGLIPLVFLLAHHIAYLEYLIPFYGVLRPLAIPISSTTGAIQVTTPTGYVQHVESIWGPLTIVLNGDVLTIFALIGIVYKTTEKLVDKLWHKSKKVRIGDLLIWPLLLAIVVTGWLATHHYPPGVDAYRFVLGFHIASAAVFVAVWPFTKYFHFLWGYWYGKLHEWYDLALKRGA
jgi:uncharacterized membrane protein